MDLAKILHERNINSELFAEKLSIPLSRVFEMFESNDDDLKWSMYFEYVQKVIDESLTPELIEFYNPYFASSDETVDFVKSILSFHNNSPRRMINLIKELVTLSDDMEQIRKGRHILKVFLLIVCTEALYKIGNKKIDKVEIIIDFFNNFISEEDQQFIKSSIWVSLADNRYIPGSRLNQNVEIETFARILNEIRNIFVHEGDFWSFSFSHGDYPLINSILVRESKDEIELVKRGHLFPKEKTYEVRLTYPELRTIYIKGLINFTKHQFDILKGT